MRTMEAQLQRNKNALALAEGGVMNNTTSTEGAQGAPPFNLYPQNIPQELIRCDQWVVWKLEIREDGKPTKPPYNARTGGKAETDNPSTWSTYHQAIEKFGRGGYSGIGIVLTDELCGLDVDYPWDSPVAQKIRAWFRGSYCERSPSGHLRVFCFGEPPRCGKGTEDKKIEVYGRTSPRYLTVTGDWLEDSSPTVTSQQTSLHWLHAAYFKPKEEPRDPPKDRGASPRFEDQVIIDKASSAKNGEKFKALFSGDWSRYPSQSEADLSLCQMLAFWTQDREQIDRLFRQSGLMRDKWDESHFSDGRTYGQETIQKALDRTRETYKAKTENPKPENNSFPEMPDLASLTLSEDEMAVARITPRVIVDEYLYADVGLLNAAGGVGKTTLVLYEAVHIATGRDLYGLEVVSPGTVLIITAEDSREILVARLRRIITGMHLTTEERVRVLSRVLIWDVRGVVCRLAEQDRKNNIVLTGLADHIVERCQDIRPVLVVFDPTVSFGAGERFVNDNEDALVNAARRIVDGVGCCVRFIQHIGKSNARSGTLDQYSSRSGSALPDGCRMVAGIRPWKQGDIVSLPPGMSEKDKDILILSRNKTTYTPPGRPLIFIAREGYEFSYMLEAILTPEQKRIASADQVERYLVSEFKRNRFYAKDHLEHSVLADTLTREELRGALSDLMASGRVVLAKLPEEMRGRGKTSYLHPAEMPLPEEKKAAKPRRTKK